MEPVGLFLQLPLDIPAGRVPIAASFFAATVP